MSQRFERPGLLTFGIVLTVLQALFMIAVLGVALLALMGVATVGIAESPHDVFPLSIIFGLGGMAVGFLILFYCAVLWVCRSAWNGSRTGIGVLIGLTALGIVNSGPFSVIIGILTIIGCVQAWDQTPRMAS